MKSFFKGKVLANSLKNIEANKARQKEIFSRLYNKPKVIQPPKHINMDQYFNFPKFIGKHGYDGMTKNALTVYPVLCSLSDFDKPNWFHISRENIAKLSGISPGTVDEGINHLINSKYVLDHKSKLIPLVERKLTTQGERHFYEYRTGFIRKSMIHDYEGMYFPFHCCIIQSRLWAKLSQRAKSLYLALRTSSKFDWYLYSEIENLDFEDGEDFYKEQYKDRLWEVCDMPLTILCNMVNIERSNIKTTIKELEEFRLIERIDIFFKVYLKPDERKMNSAN